MGDIVIVVVFLAVLFLFMWAVVLFLERRLGRQRGEGVHEEREGGEEDILPFIVAGVVAYRDSVENVWGGRQRLVHKKKEEGASWWKISRRMG